MSAYRAIGVGMVLLSTAMTALIGNPAHAAEWDTSTGNSSASAHIKSLILVQQFHQLSAAVKAPVALVAPVVSPVLELQEFTANAPGQVRPAPSTTHRTSAQRVRLAPATTAVLDRTFGRLFFFRQRRWKVCFEFCRQRRLDLRR